MPHLFIQEISGAAEDTLDDDFPESPLRHKNPELAHCLLVKDEEVSPRLRDPSPEPISREDVISQLTMRQVYLLNTYKFDENTGTHQQLTRLYIRPRPGLLDSFNVSPEFVRREWQINSPRPRWATYVDEYDPGFESDCIHALETEIRKCDRYADKPANHNIRWKLRLWALAVIPSSQQRNITARCAWPAVTPPRKTKAKLTRKGAQRIHRV
ncbi:hypothetical protein K438DRAFT_1815365 [Mycena galopus ATCC 62051]|nr:hypothetical protein K438DRAFT_1892522 [Mycena galopus ATCC 62051]KAF8195347.1 hypothetical protein K438DRAFT_1827292 [Mycena galopus ATCC 62051]KAF8206903.1 hypothetical protein K438DRAFT_1815365 [Mycena galopus ATCC 62051]